MKKKDYLNICSYPKDKHGFVFRCLSPDGKVFVGKTTRSVEERCGKFGEGFKKERALFLGILRHGWDNFVVEVLGMFPIDLLDYFTQQYIEFYRAAKPFGFNDVTIAANDVLVAANDSLLQDLVSNLSCKVSSIVLPEGTIQLDSRRNAPKSVTQRDRDGRIVGVYPSVSDAQRLTGIGHIGDCANGHRKSAGGYYWSFTEMEDVNEEY